MIASYGIYLRRLGRPFCLLAYVVACSVVLATVCVSVAGAAGIGFASGPSGWDGLITNADGSPDTQAGSHPYAVTTTFNLSETADSNGKLRAEGGDLKDLEVEVPPGFIGDINAVPICSELEFFTLDSKSNPACRDDTVVGVLDVHLGSLEDLYEPVLISSPRPGCS